MRSRSSGVAPTKPHLPLLLAPPSSVTSSPPPRAFAPLPRLLCPGRSYFSFAFSPLLVFFALGSLSSLPFVTLLFHIPAFSLRGLAAVRPTPSSLSPRRSSVTSLTVMRDTERFYVTIEATRDPGIPRERRGNLGNCLRGLICLHKSIDGEMENVSARSAQSGPRKR